MLNRKPKLYLFYCSNSFTADDLNGFFNKPDSSVDRMISLPCSGKADLLYLLKAFETGADGVVILTCPKNECKFLEGNIRAPRRAAEVDSMITESGMTAGRIIVLSSETGNVGDVVSDIEEFSKKIEPMHMQAVRV